MSPVLAIADTRILAPKSDGVLYLTRWRHTHRNAVLNGLRLLQSVGARVTGIGERPLGLYDHVDDWRTEPRLPAP